MENNEVVINLSDLPIVFAEEDSDLELLLAEWNLLELLGVLREANITYRSLQYLSADDIKEAISNIGLRAEFRQKLFYWRKEKFNIDDDTISNNSKVQSWLTGSSSSSINIKCLLENNSKGRGILDFYSKNSCLTEALRRELIEIIVENMTCNKEKTIFSPRDFSSLTNQITELFSTEQKDYYFSPRGVKKNPSGKLWYKYVNVRSKKSRQDIPTTSTQEVEVQTQLDPEFDVTIASATKLTLAREFSDWSSVKDRWRQTAALRRQEFRAMEKNCVTFFSNWPLYKHADARDLINIDFDFVYPGKGSILYSKWEEFSHNITSYYETSMKDKACKTLLANVKQLKDKNCVDYLNLLLLNAVIPPNERFKDDTGKNKRRVGIIDAQEAFILHLECINNYELKISELRSKYYNTGLTFQPTLIVVGPSKYSVTHFYLYFDGHLYKFDSFLASLDTAFKIYQIFNLEYPRACCGVWLFVQKYLYEIDTKFDKNNPNVISAINFLNNISQNQNV